MSTPGLATRAPTQDGKLENSPTNHPGQAITLPTLAAVRARLVEVIGQKPAPAPEPSPARDWVRIPTTIATPRMIATVVGVTPRAVLYWRRGERTPRWRHKRKLLVLQAMVRRARS
jgi:hypothetical protein